MKNKYKMHIFIQHSLLVICFFSFFHINQVYANELNQLNKFIGKNDALLVENSHGKILFSKNADKKLIPASILKILTSLIAKHYLGNDYRFITEFYLDKSDNLIIKGYGDPLLISEVLPEIAKNIRKKIEKFNHLTLDNSYFDSVIIPGVTSSLNPYDSPNNALCVNFNTVNFKRFNGRYISAEPQTPLLPFVLNRIRKSGLNQERIVLSAQNNEAILYAGHLFKYFFQQQGIKSNGEIKTGTVNFQTDKLIFKYISNFTLDEIIGRLLKYSNNFIANQLFITSGIKAYNPPGDINKSREAAYFYIKKHFNLNNIYMDEGSGISRKNKITANEMIKVLREFFPFRKLMRCNAREFYKTGSLKGIKTRAGYIKGKNGDFIHFVLMLNTPGKTTKSIMKNLFNLL